MEEQEPRRWELGAAWLLGALLLMQLSGFARAGGEGGPGALLWAQLVSQGALLCIAIGGASLLRGESVSHHLGLEPGRLGIPTLLLLAVGLLALSDALSGILSTLELRDTGTLGEVKRQTAATRGPTIGLALLALGIAPGVAEEVLFRGLFQRGLARHLGHATGIVGAAALFGAAHLDPVHSPAAFVLGLYLGCVAMLAGSVRAAVFCHVVNNLGATLGARFGALSLPLGPSATAPLLLVVSVTILLVVWRRAGGKSTPRDPPKRGMAAGAG